MPKVNASEFTEKWSRRLKGAIEDVRAGVDRVTEAPSKKAVAKQEKMKQNLVKSIESGQWAKNLGAISLEEWKEKMKNKGANRISAGVDESQTKVQNFAEKLLSHEASLQSDIKKLPDMTIEDSITRATTWIRGMAKFKK